MKLVKTASGKTEIKLSRSEWESIGRTAGWDDETDEADLTGWNNNNEDAPQPMTSEEAKADIINECNEVLGWIKKVLPEAELKISQGEIPYGSVNSIYSWIRQLDQNLGFYQKDYK